MLLNTAHSTASENTTSPAVPPLALESTCFRYYKEFMGPLGFIGVFPQDIKKKITASSHQTEVGKNPKKINAKTLTPQHYTLIFHCLMHQSFLQIFFIPFWMPKQPCKGLACFRALRKNSDALLRRLDSLIITSMLILQLAKYGTTRSSQQDFCRTDLRPILPIPGNKQDGFWQRAQVKKEQAKLTDGIRGFGETTPIEENRCALFLYFYNGNRLLSEGHTCCFSSCLCSIPCKGHSNHTGVLWRTTVNKLNYCKLNSRRAHVHATVLIRTFT